VRIPYVEHAQRFLETVDRGLRRLARSVFALALGEILIGAAMAPLVGPMVDRFGGRWLMAAARCRQGWDFS
jgi:hypothetical protein